MNILLHICCAPCAIAPVGELRGEGHLIGGYYFNPNIHPYSEYLKRKDAVDAYAGEAGLTVTCGDYAVREYFQHIAYNEDASGRCPVCWWLRMLQSAKFARENGFDAFTTTLLGSPYQDHAILKSVCEDVAKNCGVAFYYKDFRTGFREGQALAKAKGIYRQQYCGCLYSEMERLEKKGKGR